MVILALLALFCFNIGAPDEAQYVDGFDSEQELSSSDITTFLRDLENTKEDGMDQPEQSAPKSRTFSDIDHPVKKLDGSLESSTAPYSRDLVHKNNLKKYRTYCSSFWCKIKKTGKKIYRKVKEYISHIVNQGMDGAEEEFSAKE